MNSILYSSCIRHSLEGGVIIFYIFIFKAIQFSQWTLEWPSSASVEIGNRSSWLWKALLTAIQRSC